jgi:hypothetical protein
MAFHLNWLMRTQGDLDSAELLAQNDDDRGMRTVFELLHFEDTDRRSMDGKAIRSVICHRKR